MTGMAGTLRMTEAAGTLSLSKGRAMSTVYRAHLLSLHHLRE
jgi:hypothetical protein